MDTLSIIVIASTGVITAISGYILNSRCTDIETPCCKIKRDVIQNSKNLKINE